MLKCKVCGKPAEPIYLCKEHFACEVCGSKQNLCIRNGGVTCDSCHEKIVAKQIEDFSGDTDGTSEIVCPWCGYESQDSWELPDNDIRDCDNCGKTYRHYREVIVSYSTEKHGN